MAEFFNTYITGQEAWVFLLNGELGLLFGVFYKIYQENRKPLMKDVAKFLFFSIFCFVLSLTFRTSPLISFFIGFGAEPLATALQKSLDNSATFFAKTLLRNAGMPQEMKEKKDA
jgi:hypothetical protein